MLQSLLVSGLIFVRSKRVEDLSDAAFQTPYAKSTDPTLRFPWFSYFFLTKNATKTKKTPKQSQKPPKTTKTPSLLRSSTPREEARPMHRCGKKVPLHSAELGRGTQALKATSLERGLRLGMSPFVFFFLKGPPLLWFIMFLVYYLL